MRCLYLAVGWLSLGLGVAGIFLPLLPTTPFLLLTAFCFSRGSPTLHRWLLRQPQIGPAIRDWEEKKVVPVRAKVVATVLLIPPFLLATVFRRWSPAINIGMVCLVVGVMLFLWTRKSR